MILDVSCRVGDIEDLEMKDDLKDYLNSDTGSFLRQFNYVQRIGRVREIGCKDYL